MAGWRDRAKPVEVASGGWRDRARPVEVPSAPQREEMGAWEAAARGGAQGLTFDFADELAGLGSGVAGKLQGKGFWDSYREGRDDIRDKNAQAQEDQPWAYGGAELGTGIGTSLLTGGLGGAARGAQAVARAPGLIRALARAGISGAMGGAGAAVGSSSSDVTRGDLEGLAGDVVKGAAGGAALAVPLTAGARVLRRAGQGLVRPTREANDLRMRGVDLTLGRMDPEGAAGILEASNLNVPGVGNALKNRRNQSERQFSRLATQEATPPGFNALTDNMDENLEAINQNYNLVYDHIRNSPARTSISTNDLANRFANVLDDHTVNATEKDVEDVSRFLNRQITIPGRQSQVQPIGPGSLMTLRSNVRETLRAPDLSTPQRRLYQNAEREITDALEEMLPDAERGMLRETDRRYRNYMILEDASFKAGDRPNGVTPAMLSASLKKASASRKRDYTQGGGGSLRPITRAGRAVFDQIPGQHTGASILGTGPFRYLSGPAMLLGNTRHVQPYVIGEGRGQQQATAIADALLRHGPRLTRPSINVMWGDDYRDEQDE